MRDRPFLRAGEEVRPFSEIKAERSNLDPAERQYARMRDDIAALEAEAKAEPDIEKSRAIQCRAEELRTALYHRPRRP